MASLFERLAQGAGKALVQIGTSGMEEKRQMRLDKMRGKSSAAAKKEEQAFRTSEREAGQEFQKSMAELKGTDKKADKVKFRDVDDMTGMTTITYESGKREEYDPETDKTRILGEGKGKLSEESKGEDITWAEKMANRQAKFWSSDESDFSYFKDETKAAEAAAQFRSNARKAGNLDAFDTEFAKKGWRYIQELAKSSEPKSTEESLSTLMENEAKLQRSKAKPSKKEKKAGQGLIKIFKDFESSDYNDIATQILNDPKSPAYLKKEAEDYLSGAS